MLKWKIQIKYCLLFQEIQIFQIYKYARFTFYSQKLSLTRRCRKTRIKLFISPHKASTSHTFIKWWIHNSIIHIGGLVVIRVSSLPGAIALDLLVLKPNFTASSKAIRLFVIWDSQSWVVSSVSWILKEPLSFNLKKTPLTSSLHPEQGPEMKVFWLFYDFKSCWV